MTIDEQVAHMKRAIGAFFRARREDMQWTRNDLRNATGTSGTQVRKIEEGVDSVSTETFLRVMNALGIGMHLCQQNADPVDVVTEGTSQPPPFLLTVDAESRQMYVLHWQQPAFLVQVVQTVPHHLRFVATYGVPMARIKQLPVWEEAQAFVHEVLQRANVDLN